MSAYVPIFGISRMGINLLVASLAECGNKSNTKKLKTTRQQRLRRTYIWHSWDPIPLGPLAGFFQICVESETLCGIQFCKPYSEHPIKIQKSCTYPSDEQWVAKGGNSRKNQIPVPTLALRTLEHTENLDIVKKSRVGGVEDQNFC